MEKEKKKLKTKDDDASSSKQVQRRRYEEAHEEDDTVWFGRGKRDEIGQKESPTQNPRGYQEVKDNWDETSEQEEDIEEDTGREGSTHQLQDKTGARTTKDDENINGAEKAEEAPILRRIAKADKALVKALLRIASLVGENDKVQQELDNVLTAHSKIKALIMEQNGEIAFQKGRNLELERTAKQTGETNRDRDREEEETEIEEERPSYALVVSSGTMEKKEVAKLIKKQVDLTRLDITSNNETRTGRSCYYNYISGRRWQTPRTTKAETGTSKPTSEDTERLPLPDQSNWNRRRHGHRIGERDDCTAKPALLRNDGYQGHHKMEGETGDYSSPRTQQEGT